MIYTSRAWATTLRRVQAAQAQAQTSPHPFHPFTMRREHATNATSPPPQHHSSTNTTSFESSSTSPSSPSPSVPPAPAKPALPNPSQSSIVSLPAHSSSSQPSPTTAKPIPSPSWLWLESVYEPFRAYGRVQRRRPYLTQFASALVIYFIGDLVAQGITKDDTTNEVAPNGCEDVDENEEVGWVQEWVNGRDWNRTGRALMIGGLAAVPGYRWFLWLSNSFNYSSKVLSLATKVTVNQVVFTPIFNSYFFGMQYLLSPPPAHPHDCSSSEPPHRSLHDLVERLKATVPVSWMNSCKIWPAVTAFSFSFIPIEYRNIFGGVIAIGWQTYLNILNRRAEEAQLGVGGEGEADPGSNDENVAREGLVVRRMDTHGRDSQKCTA